jgi:starch phosphorylase
MKAIQQFHVLPTLPPQLARLHDLAMNLHWAWDPDTIGLFRRLDPELWETTGRNPVALLGQVSQKRLAQLADDDRFVAHLRRVAGAFDEYLRAESAWYDRCHPQPNTACIAYFCAEFGITDCLAIYSGGLGILAGDHLKSSSDLGVPLVGVGLFYQGGYFRQYLNADGWQQERYPLNQVDQMPITLVRDDEGEPVTVIMHDGERALKLHVWLAQVGRVRLYLLDSNVAANTLEQRAITGELYGGDQEIRIRQERVLGIGGVRALKALGIDCRVFHMNEGHAGFLAIERIREARVEHGLTFDEAIEYARASQVFTTHTPVPAGIDLFEPQLMDRYFQRAYAELGISREQFLALGRHDSGDPNAPFSMAILCLRLSRHANGVSRLHGQESRRMFKDLYPGVVDQEVPISHVTNGVHYPSWISKEFADLYDRYLGPRWGYDPTDAEIWQRVKEIPDEELWRTHTRRRERLVAFARRCLVDQLSSRSAPPSHVRLAHQALNANTLTIGFARRFATYKRAVLLLHDPERLVRILTDPQRPVQIIIAGKAHPKDHAGKELIRQWLHFARREEVRQRVVFIEDYDMHVARYMVQGTDVWLNNPLRPMEASGTSGMKAACNGVLNLSVLDGWWDEAFQPGIGWAIGGHEVYTSREEQDRVEASALYDLLEKEVVPLFYERGADNVPVGWIQMMQHCLATLGPLFSSHRMVYDYAERFYSPIASRCKLDERVEEKEAQAMAAWRRRVREAWDGVRIVAVQADGAPEQRVGDHIAVRVEVELSGLPADELSTQLYYGSVDPHGEIREGTLLRLHSRGDGANGRAVFEGAIPCQTSGKVGYAVRVVPFHVELGEDIAGGLIRWWQA